nr:hypothetical protein [Arthrobacter pascens]
MHVLTVACSQTVVLASGWPLSPAQTEMDTSSAAVLERRERPSQYFAPSPRPPAQIPRMSR